MAKVVFCQRVVYSLFGVMSMSAVLKAAGHEVELVMEPDIEKTVNEILDIAPDIAAFSVLVSTGEYEWAVRIAGRLKQLKPEITIVFGNLYPTLFPDNAISDSSVDVLCAGEGEYAMLDLCERIDRNSDYCDILNLWVRRGNEIVKNPVRDLIGNLDELPRPDRTLYDKYGYFDSIRSIDVMAGRCCAYSCSYCYNHVLKKTYGSRGNMVRRHSVDYVIDELKDIISRYKSKSFTFVDELFVLDKTWLAEFAEKYSSEIAVPFICNVRADIVDEEVVALLLKAGAARVCFGVESGNEDIRNKLLNKPITDNQIIEAAKYLHFYGIKFLTANMLGLPGETIENAFETVALNRKIKADYLYFSVFQPYPGLKITEYAMKSGYITESTPAGFNTTYFRGSVLNQKDIDKLVNLHKLFFLAVKFPVFTGIYKILIRFPSNFVFDLIFMMSFGWMQLTCFRRSPKQLFLMGTGNLKVFLSRRE